VKGKMAIRNNVRKISWRTRIIFPHHKPQGITVLEEDEE
jgi:hypothetical protein